MIESNELTDIELAYAQARAYGKDIARLYAAEKARRKDLETTTQKLQAIFDTAPNGLVVVDDTLKVVEANPRFLTLFQEEPDSVIGRPLGKLLPVEALFETMELARQDNVDWGDVEIEITEPVVRTFLISLSSLGNNQGWVLIFHDLTERKRLENLKDEFVNIAAHELRTPLAGVIGFVGVLEEELKQLGDPMMNRLIDLILHSTERLRLTIDELVHFAAIECKADHNLHIADIDLSQILRESVELFRHQLEANNISCHFELPGYPLIVQGDRFILGEVFYQLLNNAITFNKAGGKIIIRAGSDISEETGENVTLIEIEDTGIGIPQTDLDKIFDKFYQVEEHLTRGIGGLGLGLTIAWRGVEQHGGKIIASSQLGQGSSFRIMLPSVIQPHDVSIDTRVDVAHQQMLTYAKDMAQAVAAERRMHKQMEQIRSLSTRLAEIFKPLSLAETDDQDCVDTLSQAQDIIQELVKLSEQTAA